MQIVAAAAETTPATTPEASQVDPAAAALAAAAAEAPASTEDALRAKSEEAAQADAPARPEWLPEGFETPEDFAKAYAELKAGQKPEEKPEGQTDAPAEEKKEGETEEQKPTAVVDVKAVSAEFAEKGELSEATYADLAAKGFDKEFVDSFIEGQKARADAVDRRLTDAAGGKDHLDRMFAWASTSMTAAEIETYNASFANADVTAAELAIKDLRGKYEAANGREGSGLLNGKNLGSAADTFGSWAEVTQAMSDPRYEKDPAYRAKIEAKIGRSNI